VGNGPGQSLGTSSYEVGFSELKKDRRKKTLPGRLQTFADLLEEMSESTLSSAQGGS